MPSFASFDKRFPRLLAAALALFVTFCGMSARAQDTAISAPQTSIQSAPATDTPEPAEEKQAKGFSQALAPDVEEALTYLLGLPGRRDRSLDPARLAPLLAMATGPAFDARALKPAKREGGNGVCLREDLKAPLERIMRYGYNRDIPNHVIFPSVLRLTGWEPGSDILLPGKGLWQLADGDLPAPVQLWGREFEVNTPDSSTGAYYRYELDRFIALLRVDGKNVLVSISRMPKESEGGRKGVPMDDQNWNYFYSGIEGLDRGLIGWMDTTLYNSCSVQVFVEQDTAEPRTTCLLFKWLAGGWAGLNVIMPRHIYDGNLRFIKGFKKVMESAALPDSERFAAAVREIRALPDSVLDEKIRSYSLAFEQLARNYPNMDKSEFRKIWENGGYAKVLDREQRLGILALEYLKAKVGKPVLVDLSMIDKALAAKPGGDSVAALAPEQGKEQGGTTP
ncbi:hypothetical protein M7784_05665 [Desulfovibrio aminophilus]|nr:hypothetical protein [Desulfovibrio aminophilus]MCM0754731.1 hypothetical protein [Desulfovibrio aminophilus]